MKKQNKELRLIRGNNKMIVRHNKKDLIFLHPAYEPGDYLEVAKQIEKEGLRMPTMAETVSLIYAALNPKDERNGDIERKSEEVIRTFRKNGFVTSTGVVYVPKKGAYIQDNLKQENLEKVEGKIVIKEDNDLEKRVEEDPNLRFVPIGFEKGQINPNKLRTKMSPRSMEKNEFIIALIGEEGAQKLAEIAGKFPAEPYLGCLPYRWEDPSIWVESLWNERLNLWGLSNVDEPRTGICTLNLSLYRVNFDGLSMGNGGYGSAFGVMAIRGNKNGKKYK